MAMPGADGVVAVSPLGRPCRSPASQPSWQRGFYDFAREFSCGAPDPTLRLVVHWAGVAPPWVVAYIEHVWFTCLDTFGGFGNGVLLSEANSCDEWLLAG